MKNENLYWRFLIVAGAVIAAIGVWPMLNRQINLALCAEIIALTSIASGLTLHFLKSRLKGKLRSRRKATIGLCAALSFAFGMQTAGFAQGTAFTYQGRLNFNGAPAAGNFDFRFRVATDANGNNFVGSPFLTNALPVTNGLFLSTIDFGAGVFLGGNLWLQIEVKTNAAAGYMTLFPLQNLTPTPYAMFANTASNVSGTVSAAQIGGTILNTSLPASPNFSGTVTANSISGNGVNVTNVNAALLNGKSAANFWQAAGNAGTSPASGNFLGTTDNQPLELRVNSLRALRLDPNANSAGHTNLVNLVGGSPGNFISAGVYGSVIAGGGAVNYFGSGTTNAIFTDVSFIGGGYGNQILGASFGGVIGGGAFNVIQTNATVSFIGSGQLNSIQSGAFDSFIGGGYQNNIGTNSNNSFIGGGYDNIIAPNAIGGTIGGGYGNFVLGAGATIAGGGMITFLGVYGNQASGPQSFIGGGNNNFTSANATNAVVTGGCLNSATTNYSTVSGGFYNGVLGFASTVPGGFNNYAFGDYSLAAGTKAVAGHPGAFVWADSTSTGFNSTTSNQFAVYSTGGVLFYPGTNNLELGSGGLKITGAGINTGTAAFTQLTSAANVVGDNTIINNPLCNNDPNAILIITHNYNPGGAPVNTLYTKPVGVFYSNGKWRIYNEDLSNMSTNVAFNVLVIKP